MRSLIVAVALVASLVAGTAAQAQQTVQGGRVVHSRVAPVVMHRVLPPFGGVHVYGGRR
jgi:hypothetical protein